MNKIVYSGFLKFLAVILFVASIVGGILTAANGMIAFFSEESDIYDASGDFSQSWYASYLLKQPENVVYNAYHNVLFEYDERGYLIDLDEEEVEQRYGKLASAIEVGLQNLSSDEINYYVQWNDKAFTNCSAIEAGDLLKGDYYRYLERDNSGNIETRSTMKNTYETLFLDDIARFDRTSTIIIGCSLTEEAVTKYQAIWEKQEQIFITTVMQTLVCAVAALLLFIYLLCVCGKKSNGEYTNMWLDNIWVEMHLAAMAGAGTGVVGLCVILMDEYMYGDFPQNLLLLAIGMATALGSLIMITAILSVVRNIKTRRLTGTSIILRTLRWILRLIKRLWTVNVKFLSRKTGVILVSMLFVYTALIGAFGVGTAFYPICLFFGVWLFAFACAFIAYRSKDLDEVKKGVSQVRNGNAAYKIPEPKCSDMKGLAENINDIARGIDEAVAAKVKAERMKTELITNVSHDLKTPITSIISYTELLLQMEELPQEARDYVSVIAKKSDRLKKLTQDLFDISKVQSGNETVILEKLDVALLINQSLAEYDNEIQNSGLQFCVETPKDLHISADGRKMSRVISNLINNILKYSMKNTRVFITAKEKDEYVVMEFKNISAYPLNFNAEEITQRFVRGDEARSAEGNGLGLAIVKSYTEICNGTLEIVIDGDLFKAIVKLKKYS